MLHLHHHSYSYEDIRRSNSQGTTHHPAWQLAHDWLTGRKEYVFKTSGSTGMPKEFRFTREQVKASITRTTEALKLSSTDHFLCCLSMQSVAGAMTIFRAVDLNATITVLEANSHPLTRITELHPFTVASFVPMQLHDLTDHKGMMDKLNRFKTILIGGATLNEKIEAQLKKCKAAVYQTYGMTETLSHIALYRIGEQDAFHLLNGVEMKTDKRGCLCIRADVTKGEWITTNDLVELLPNQSFRMLGRADQVINSGGFKVMPAKVEAVVAKHLHGKNFFVHGLSDARLGEQVTLFIEGKEDKHIDKWWERLSDELHEYEIPRQLVYLSAFEKTESGKVDRIKTARLMQQAAS